MAQYMKRQLNSVKGRLKVYAYRLVSVNLCFCFCFLILSTCEKKQNPKEIRFQDDCKLESHQISSAQPA